VEQRGAAAVRLGRVKPNGSTGRVAVDGGRMDEQDGGHQGIGNDRVEGGKLIKGLEGEN